MRLALAGIDDLPSFRSQPMRLTSLDSCDDLRIEPIDCDSAGGTTPSSTASR